MPATIFFDVNETLSDLGPLAEALSAVGAPAGLASTWFGATLRDGFALTLTTGAQPFQRVARQTLTGLLSLEQDRTLPLDDSVDQVMEAFLALPLHPDVLPGVRALEAAGHSLYAFSNGSSEYAQSLLARAGVLDAFTACLSVDDARAWKPDPRAYRFALASAGVSAGDAALVAVHPWDLHGARQAGLTTVFVDRNGSPWPDVFAEPDLRVGGLDELRLG